LSSAAAQAGSPEVHYVPTPAWAIPPPPPTNSPNRPDAPLRFLYLDTQVRIGAEGEETYAHWRLKILSPERLKAGNLILGWIPTSDDMSCTSSSSRMTAMKPICSQRRNSR
jgi:hypothetical protein